MSAFKNKKFKKLLISKKNSRTLKILKDLKVSKVQILSDKKMDAHVQKQTYYQLRGTSWIIGIGWQQHSRATNYLSQQANSRLSKTQNFKKNRVEIFVKVKLKSKLLKGENILKQILIPINYMFPKCFFYLHSSVWLLKLTVIHCFGRVLTMNWTLNIVYHLVKLSMFSLKRVLIGWTAQLQLRTLLLTSEAFWIDLWWVI